MKTPYIIYSLSKDRTTQKFNKNKFQEIMREIDIFLKSCSTANINVPEDIKLTSYTAWDESDLKEVLLNIIDKTTRRFGPCDDVPVEYHSETGEPLPIRHYTWTLPKEMLDEAVEYIMENSPMPKSNFGPLVLHFYYFFKLVDPTNKQELPSQVHHSDMSVWFSRGKACSADLFFPFEKADKKFWNFIDSIIPFLPFKLEEKYLKIAHVNKQGEIKSFKKIQRAVVA